MSSIKSHASQRSWFVALSEFVRHPGMVGSAFPASERMVARTLAPIDWPRVDIFVEFGSGTGRFTKAALARMKPGAALLAIETDEAFADNLRATIIDRRLIVHHGSAAELADALASNGLGAADCILSGLPFSTLPPQEAAQIVRLSRRLLAPAGVFAAYQMRKAIEPLLREHFARLESGFEWWNIPPCHHYWASGGEARTAG